MARQRLLPLPSLLTVEKILVQPLLRLLPAERVHSRGGKPIGPDRKDDKET